MAQILPYLLLSNLQYNETIMVEMLSKNEKYNHPKK